MVIVWLPSPVMVRTCVPGSSAAVTAYILRTSIGSIQAHTKTPPALDAPGLANDVDAQIRLSVCENMIQFPCWIGVASPGHSQCPGEAFLVATLCTLYRPPRVAGA